MSRHTLLLLAAALAALPLPPAGAQAPPPPRGAAPDSVVVVPDSTFGRGGLRRFLLGDHYRDLWNTPTRVEVLNLATHGGGLTPIRRGGGRQTRSLRLRAADGREYAFRVLRKSPEAILPEDLRGTFAEGVVRDQMSAIHPGGALVVTPILDAAGVLHAPPVLRVMPDDLRLGEFRDEFAGELGTLEERPLEADDDLPGFAGAGRIEDTWKLIEALWDRPWVAVNARAFLTARLLDHFVGDWDRHEDQWKWALLGDGDGARWEPIPRDRDQAFARYDGVLLALTRWSVPQLLNFDEDYASPVASTWNGRHLDRRLLNGLEREVWDSAARALQARLTDDVLRAAVARMPVEFRARNGDRLFRTLQQRRDKLPAAAERLYRHLAAQVSLDASDHDDLVSVQRGPAGTEVQIRRRGQEAPYYLRTFRPAETGEVRIYLRGGDDRAEVTGGGGGRPLIRIVAGSGRDTLRSENTGGVRFYDVGDGTVTGGAAVDRRPYVRESDADPTVLPERDWGSLLLGTPRVRANSDLGLVLGIGFDRRSFGFRRQPYATSVRAAVDYSFLRTDGRVELDLRRKRTNSEMYWVFGGLASALEGLRFHGFGNGTLTDQPRDFYRVEQQTFEAGAGVAWGLEGPVSLLLRIRTRHTITDLNDPDNAEGLIGQLRPLGVGDFGQLGGSARFTVDTRDHRVMATKGVLASAEGAWYPVVWGDALDGFGLVEGWVATYLSPVRPGWVTLALRAGGRKAWGDVPYFEAAYLGGRGSLRGYPHNRFAGDGAAYGNAELRLKLANAFVVFPGELGVFGLADVGRVFSDFAAVKEWHPNAGAGFFYTIFRRAAGLSLGIAGGDEGRRFYLGFGTF